MMNLEIILSQLRAADFAIAALAGALGFSLFRKPTNQPVTLFDSPTEATMAKTLSDLIAVKLSADGAHAAAAKAKTEADAQAAKLVADAQAALDASITAATKANTDITAVFRKDNLTRVRTNDGMDWQLDDAGNPVSVTVPSADSITVDDPAPAA